VQSWRCETMEDIDIWRTAKLLVDRHGKDAELEACQRADQALGNGDIAGLRTWKKVRDAVVTLNRRQPPAGEHIH
jgi:hypothetical protein